MAHAEARHADGRPGVGRRLQADAAAHSDASASAAGATDGDAARQHSLPAAAQAGRRLCHRGRRRRGRVHLLPGLQYKKAVDQVAASDQPLTDYEMGIDPTRKQFWVNFYNYWTTW